MTKRPTDESATVRRVRGRFGERRWTTAGVSEGREEGEGLMTRARLLLGFDGVRTKTWLVLRWKVTECSKNAKFKVFRSRACFPSTPAASSGLLLGVSPTGPALSSFSVSPRPRLTPRRPRV
jgi:hypothetical protein